MFGLRNSLWVVVLDQVRTQVRLLEAQEDAEAEEKKEEDNGALQSAG